MSFQFTFSKNVCIPSASRPCPESSTSPAGWLSLAEEWRCRWGLGVVRVLGVGDSFQMARDELSKKPVVLQPLIHWGHAWICYLGLLKISLRQKLQNGLSMNFFLETNFKHNKYKKEEWHEPCISSFSINNYKTNILVPLVVIDRRLCNIKVVANWFPSRDILDLHQSFSFCMFSHVVVEGKEGEGEWERNRARG